MHRRGCKRASAVADRGPRGTGGGLAPDTTACTVAQARACSGIWVANQTPKEGQGVAMVALQAQASSEEAPGPVWSPTRGTDGPPTGSLARACPGRPAGREGGGGTRPPLPEAQGRPDMARASTRSEPRPGGTPGSPPPRGEHQEPHRAGHAGDARQPRQSELPWPHQDATRPTEPRPPETYQPGPRH